MRIARLISAKNNLTAPFAVLIALALMHGQAQAQAQPQYKEARAHATYKTWGNVKTANERKAIDDMLRGAASFDEAAFTDFFVKIVFPQFTLKDNIYGTKTVNKLKNTVCALPDMRRDFRQLFMGREHTSQQARTKLNELTLKWMGLIASDNFHPLARYNAMLLIADLDREPGLDTPYAPALVEMVKALVNPASPDAVRVAALVGIHRHAQAGVEARYEQPLAAKLVELIRVKTPPNGRTRQGHDWMRRQALDALTAINARKQTQDASFIELLDAILQEEDATLELRAAAVESLLAVKFTAPQKFDPARMASSIARIAVDAYHGELEASDQSGRAVVLEPGLKYYATLAQRGLAALAAVAPSPKIDELNTKVANLLELSAEDSQPHELYDLIASNGAALEAAVTGKALTDILPERAPVNPGPPGGGYSAPGYNPDAGRTIRAPHGVPRYQGQGGQRYPGQGGAPGYPGQRR
jgi:hypothetical protein